MSDASFAQGYAVVVGVGADLPVTVRDAEAVAGLLVDPSRCAYPTQQVRLLTEGQADRASVLSALRWLADSVRGGTGTTALVYFSGHGLRSPSFHLLTHGYDLQRLPATALAETELSELLRHVEAERLVVILDCCHAGGQVQAKSATWAPAAMPATAMRELSRGSGRVVLASSRQDETSLTAEPYSEFTTALLEGLAGYGAFERDGYARILDLAMYVGRVVPNRTGNRQHPILKVSNLEDNFALAHYAGGASSPKALPGRPLPGALPGYRRAPSRGQPADFVQQLRQGREHLIRSTEQMGSYLSYAQIPPALLVQYQQAEQALLRLEGKTRPNLAKSMLQRWRLLGTRGPVARGLARLGSLKPAVLSRGLLLLLTTGPLAWTWAFLLILPQVLPSLWASSNLDFELPILFFLVVLSALIAYLGIAAGRCLRRRMPGLALLSQTMALLMGLLASVGWLRLSV